MINVLCEVRDVSELNKLKDELKCSMQLNKQYREILINYGPIVTNASQKITVRDPKMQSLLDELPRMGDSDATMLIYG
ncbi:MAG TPA: hypothetical protein VFC84_14365 [Desulfosporosinus sp.]|nr:hypothetical protein [Desulfosporosinus sp.]